MSDKTGSNPFDWDSISDKSTRLTPCEESYYYLNKWKSEGRKSVLDLGCGLGRHALLFARHGFKVTAVDISQSAIDFLKGQCKEQDIYLPGEDEPVTHFEGRVIAVFHRLNDNEDKWIVAKGAKDLTKQEILDSIDFQERFFDGELYMGGK